MPVNITLKQDVWISGVRQTANSTISVEESLAAQLIFENKADRPLGWNEYHDNTGLGGVSVNGTPSSDDVLVAVSENAAEWKSPARNIITYPTFSATVTNNSNVLSNVSSFTNISVNDLIVGNGIESGSLVVSINQAGASLTLSKTCKGATLTNTTCTIFKKGAPGGVPSVPSPQQGLQLSDGGWDYPNGFSPLFNYRPSYVRKFIVARAAAIAGMCGGAEDGSVGQSVTYSSNILIYGDSVPSGNAPSGAQAQNKLKHTPCYILSKILSKMSGMDVLCNSILGRGPSEDPRKVFGAGWATADFGGVPSTLQQTRNSTTTNAFDFTPEEDVDSFDIYVINSTGTQWSWAIDNGAETTITTISEDNNKLVKHTVSAGAAGIHKLSIKRVSGTVSIHNIIPKLSTRFELNVVDMSWPGGSLSERNNWGGADNNSSRQALIYNPALVLLMWGYTDVVDAANPLTSISGFISNYTTEINRWKSANIPVVLVTNTPWDDVNLYKDDAARLNVTKAIKDLAISLSIPVIDMAYRWGSWQENGGMITHYARLDATGSADLAYTWARAIASM